VTEIRGLLVPIDFSAHSARVLDEALAQAHKLGARSPCPVLAVKVAGA
jgi:nucleotide-binding universal stress UspA family protein